MMRHARRGRELPRGHRPLPAYTDANLYRWLGEQVDIPGSDFTLLPGQGFGMWVVFESSRFRTPYVAVKLRPNLELNLEEEQVGFQLLRRLVDLQDELEELPQGEPARADSERELQQGESFLEYLIELQTAYGISNFF